MDFDEDLPHYRVCQECKKLKREWYGLKDLKTGQEKVVCTECMEENYELCIEEN